MLKIKMTNPNFSEYAPLHPDNRITEWSYEGDADIYSHFNWLVKTGINCTVYLDYNGQIAVFREGPVLKVDLETIGADIDLEEDL